MKANNKIIQKSKRFNDLLEEKDKTLVKEWFVRYFGIKVQKRNKFSKKSNEFKSYSRSADELLERVKQKWRFIRYCRKSKKSL